MASRYAVATGTWDASNTTIWSATDGGGAGASAPTSSDDVFFTALSGAITVTTSGVNQAQCRNFDATGFTGTLTISTNQISMNPTAGGTIKFVAGMTTSGSIAFTCAAGANCTFTTGGKNLTVNLLGGASGGMTLADDWTGAMNFTSGTFNTANKTINWSSFISSNTNTRTFSPGSSIINLTSFGTFNMATTTGLTWSVNTATLTLTTGASVFNAGGINTNGLNLVFTGVGSPQINGTNGLTLGSLTRTGTASRTDGFVTSINVTVTGAFTVTGNSAINRVLMTSITQGTAATITAGSVSFTNVDFRDITAAGAAIPWTGTSIGDALGNTNITFTTATTRYWVGGGGNWSDTTHWSASSGGASGATVPLAHDNVFFTASSGTGTATVDMARIGKDIDMSASSILTVTATVAGGLFGSLTLKSGMTVGYNPAFSGRSAANLTTNGATFSGGSNIVVTGYGITLNLMDNITAGSGYTFFHRAGTINTNNVTINMGAWSADNSVSPRILNAGSSVFNLASTGTIWNISDTTSLTMNMGTSEIRYTTASASARVFAGGGFTYGTLTYTVAGSTGQLSITGSNTFNTINFSDVTNARSLLFTAGTTTTVTNWNVNGTSGKLMTVDSVTAATHTLTKPSGIVSSDYLSIKNSIATGGAKWYAGANSTNVSGNSGWIFTVPPTDFAKFFLNF